MISFNSSLAEWQEQDIQKLHWCILVVKLYLIHSQIRLHNSSREVLRFTAVYFVKPRLYCNTGI